jgi:hypothetical protein
MVLRHGLFIAFLLLQPELGDVLFIALTHCALVSVAHALLGPEWTLLLDVYLECGKVGFALFQKWVNNSTYNDLVQHRPDFAIQFL